MMTTKDFIVIFSIHVYHSGLLENIDRSISNNPLKVTGFFLKQFDTNK